MSASFDSFQLKVHHSGVKKCTAHDGHTGEERKVQPMPCNLGLHLELPKGCKLQLLGAELPQDAPIALCVGEGAASVHAAGVRTLHLRPGPDPLPMLPVARSAFKEVFRRAREQHSKGVYLVGSGIGALFAAKLLSDQKFFEECSASHLLHAAYLICGIYDLKNPTLQSFLQCHGSPETIERVISPSSSPPKGDHKKHSLIENLISHHQSFKDRNNLSFVCDMSNRCPHYDKYDSDEKKSKQTHGLHVTQEETLKNSPVFQNFADLNINNEPKDIEKCDTNATDVDENKSTSLNEIEMLKVLARKANDFSPLFDSYKHLRKLGVRIYVFAAEKDSPGITKQSRDMFDRFATHCDQEDMHYQVKEKVDRNRMRELLCEEDNFLRRLIRYDIVKHL